MNVQNNNITDIKMLASSIADTLDILYHYSAECSMNTIEEMSKVDGAIFTIQAAAERLAEMIDELEQAQPTE